MPGLARLMPIERHRRRHTLRAKVIAHTAHTTGMWFWKQTYPCLKVRFSEGEHDKFWEILEQTRDADGRCPGSPPQEVEVGMTSFEDHDQYQIGEEVEVLFSTSNGIDNFFTGAEMFRWDGIQKLQVPPSPEDQVEEVPPEDPETLSRDLEELDREFREELIHVEPRVAE
jgi:hypothetical protein